MGAPHHQRKRRFNAILVHYCTPSCTIIHRCVLALRAACRRILIVHEFRVGPQFQEVYTIPVAIVRPGNNNNTNCINIW